MLLTAHELKEQLEHLYADAPYELPELKLRQPGLSEHEVKELEEGLVCHIAPSLRAPLQTYSLNPLTIGGVTIGSSARISDFILDYNVDPLTPWWGNGIRPPQEVFVGSSDGFAILADISTGYILAVRHGEEWGAAEVIAQDMELFIRGLGTAHLKRLEAEIIAREVGAGSLSFWREFAAGRA